MKLVHRIGAALLGATLSIALLGAVYNQFSPGGALSGTWNSQNVNVAAGTPFITGTLPAGNGGTGSAFTAFTGPNTTVKTLTLPNANATLLSDAAAVSTAQGGTGLTAPADDTTIISNGTVWQEKAIGSCSGATNALTYNTGTNSWGCNTIGGGATVLSTVKAADTSRASTTTTSADPDLSFTNVPAGTYLVEGYFSVVSGTVPGIKVALGSSAAPSSGNYNVQVQGQTVTASSVNWFTDSFRTAAGGNNYAADGGNLNGIEVKGMIVLANSTTEVFLQWAQATSNATNTTFQAGSWLRLTLL